MRLELTRFLVEYNFFGLRLFEIPVDVAFGNFAAQEDEDVLNAFVVFVDDDYGVTGFGL